MMTKVVSRLSLAGLWLWLGLASAQAQSAPQGATEARIVRPSSEVSAKIFDNCAICHSAPLLDLATDRAWINGISQTA